MNMSVPDRTTGGDDSEYLPADIRSRIIMHGESTPYHRQVRDQLRKEKGMDYSDIMTEEDLRTVFDYIDDEDLIAMSPEELCPDHYDDEELILSRSSGTTGEPKEIYWHEEDVLENVDYMEEKLREEGMPEDEYWLATVTPNPVLKYALEELSDRFDGELKTIEVNPAPVKKALMSGEEERIQEAFDEVSQPVRDAFDEHDVGVYEDIAPMMEYVGTQLDDEQKDALDTALIGGVGTDRETVDTITNELFPETALTGWYGDYMNGFSMMDEPASLEYFPNSPEIMLEIREFDDRDQRVERGEEGEIISHAIRRGFFVPNRRIGDRGRRIRDEGVDGVTEIGRLE